MALLMLSATLFALSCLCLTVLRDFIKGTSVIMRLVPAPEPRSEQ
jgi:hypothetical protein